MNLATVHFPNMDELMIKGKMQQERITLGLEIDKTNLLNY